MAQASVPPIVPAPAGVDHDRHSRAAGVSGLDL